MSSQTLNTDQVSTQRPTRKAKFYLGGSPVPPLTPTEQSAVSDYTTLSKAQLKALETMSTNDDCSRENDSNAQSGSGFTRSK